MKNLVWVLALILSSGLYSQESGNLAGTIKDQEVFDDGVVFAQVRLRDTEFKTQTNFKGNFEMKDVSPGHYTLEVTYAGYETLEIPVEVKQGELTRISSAMSAKRLSLDDLNSAISETHKESESQSETKISRKK
jgi:acetolactate synthase small subunit